MTNTDSVDWLPVFLVIMILDVTLCRLHISQNIILSAFEYVSHVRPIVLELPNSSSFLIFFVFFFYGFIGFCFLRRGNSIKKSSHAVIIGNNYKLIFYEWVLLIRIVHLYTRQTAHTLEWSSEWYYSVSTKLCFWNIHNVCYLLKLIIACIYTNKKI